nr:MAG TPA: hypothetical protein [Caudoviricetes sp.]
MLGVYKITCSEQSVSRRETVCFTPRNDSFQPVKHFVSSL